MSLLKRCVFALLVTLTVMGVDLESSAMAGSCSYLQDDFSGQAEVLWETGNYGAWSYYGGTLDVTDVPESSWAVFQTTVDWQNYFSVDVDIQVVNTSSPEASYALYPFSSTPGFTVGGSLVDGVAVVVNPQSATMYFMAWDVEAAEWIVSDDYPVPQPLTSFGLSLTSSAVIFRANGQDTQVKLAGAFPYSGTLVDTLWLMAGEGSHFRFDNLCADVYDPQSPGSPPAAPAMTYAVNGNDLTVNWNAVAGATGYTLNYAVGNYSGTSSLISKDLGNQTSFAYAYLNPGTTYTIAVRAYNSYGSSAYSNVQTFTVPLSVPAAPTMTHAVNGSNLTVNWNAVAGATGYTLNYAVGPYSGTSSLISMDLGDQTSFAYAYLNPGTTYTIAVRAYNGQGSSAYSNVQTFTAPLPVPAAPTMTHAANGSNLTVNWNAVSGATGYTLHYAVGAYTGTSSLISMDLGDQTSFAYAYLNPGTTYTIAVRAYNGQGSSAYSNVQTFTAGPPASDPKLVLGDPVTVTTQTVPAGGTTLTVSDPQSPLDGFAIEVPADSYTASKSFKVSSQNVSSHSFGVNFNPASPLISVDNGGEISKQPMTVTIPAEIPQGHFAMAFYYDPVSGALEGLPILKQNSDSVTVVTRHFSKILVSSISEVELRQSLPIETGFMPGQDDWQFTNYGSWLAPGGHCAGQAITAMWYYDTQKLGDGAPNLYRRFDNNGSSNKTPNLWHDDSNGYRFASVIQNVMWDEVDSDDMIEAQGFDPALTWKAFAYAMLVTGRPQMVFIFRPGGGHAIVAYAMETEGTGVRLRIADPNKPGNTGYSISFDNSGETIGYTTAANAAEIAAGNARIYPDVYYIGKSALIPWSSIEPYYDEMLESTIGEGFFPEVRIMMGHDTAAGYEDVDISAGEIETYDPTVTLKSITVDAEANETWPEFYVLEGLDDTSAKKTEFDKFFYPTLVEGDNWFGIYTVGGGKYIDFHWVNIIYHPNETFTLAPFSFQDQQSEYGEANFNPAPYTCTGSLSIPNLHDDISEDTTSWYNASLHVWMTAADLIATGTVISLPSTAYLSTQCSGLWNMHFFTLPNSDQVSWEAYAPQYKLTITRPGNTEQVINGGSSGNFTIPLNTTTLKEIANGLYLLEAVVTFNYNIYETVVGSGGYNYEGVRKAHGEDAFLRFINLYVEIPQPNSD